MSINIFYSLSSLTLEHVDWDFRFPRNPTGRELCKASKLLGILTPFRLWESIEDRRFWLGVEEDFSIKSPVAELPPTALLTLIPFFEAVWKSPTPSKVQFFALLVAKKRVNTIDRIQNLNLHSSLLPNMCSLCLRANEDAEHYSSGVGAASRVWGWLFSKLNLDFCSVYVDALLQIHDSPGSRLQFGLWCL